MPSSNSSSSSSSAPSSPETPKKTRGPSNSTSEKHKESNTTKPLKMPSKSPSNSPETSTKVLKSPPKEHKGSSSPEPPKKPSKPAPRLPTPSSPETPAKPPKASPKVVKASPVGRVAASGASPLRASFKSSLQVMLKRQGQELEKNIEYKEKLERGELDEDEDENEGQKAVRGGKGERRGSEELLVEEMRRKKKSEDGNKRGAQEEQKVKPKGDEDERKKKTNEKIAKEKQEEEKLKRKEKKTDEEEENREKQGGVTETEKGEKQRGKEEKTEVEEQNDKREEKGKKGKVKEADEEEETSEAMERKEKEEEKKKEETAKKERERKEKEDEERKKEEAAKKEEKMRKEKEEEEEEKRKEEAVKKEEQTKRAEKEEGERERKRKEDERRKMEAERKEEQKREETKERRKMKKETKEEKFQGYLHMKRKRAFNPWKEYYFVVDGQLLTYYSSKKHYEDLGAMKGSLDLTLVDEVTPRKPGLMKTHHPIRLGRRNLPSIHLAAATKDGQEWWMEVLGPATRSQRLSTYSSDKTLHTASASEAPSPDSTSAFKASTLPARVKDINSCSSSITEEGEKEDDEEEPNEEEEPELIKPKKVPMVPMGLPMAKVSLGEIKLKKLKKSETQEDGEKTITTTEDDAHKSSSSPAELFGVVLKKAKKQEEAGEEEGREKEALKEAATTTTTPATPARRPLKQPVIPLNPGKLLVVPPVKSQKTSPPTQKRQTPERRKSPSPSLPISKSVQALTKSAEEVKATQVDVSSEPSTAESGKTGIKLCHAQTMEVKYNDVEMMDEEEVQAANGKDKETKRQDAVMEKEYVEKVKTERRDADGHKKDVTSKDEVQEAGKDAQEKTTREDPVAGGGGTRHEEKDEEAASKTQPLMSIEDALLHALNASEEMRELEEKLDKENQNVMDKKTVSESPAGDRSREKDSEEALSVPSPLTPPASPASSQTSADSDKSPPPSSPAPPPPNSSSCSTKPFLSSPKLSPSLPHARPLSPKSKVSENETQPNARTMREGEEVEGSLGASPETGRHRSYTNESTASSNTEGGDKKSGKLQRLKKKLKSSTSFKKEKEEPVIPAEPKKRRGSNTLAVLLAGKKSGGKKHPEEEPQPHTSEDEAKSESPASPRRTVTTAPQEAATALSESPPSEVSPPPDQGLPRVTLQEAHPTPPQRAEDSPLPHMDRFLSGQLSPEDAAPPHLTLSSEDKVLPDRQNLFLDFSSVKPPAIPEKTRRRAKSPKHDVPRSNRPVDNTHEMDMDDEDEASQTVDGIMTDEQIAALLSARENKEERKRSKNRTQLSQAEKGASLPTGAPPPSAEDWDLKRPTFTSFSSIESEDSMPVTNFLGTRRGSSSSGSLRGAARRSLEVDGEEHTYLAASESGESLSPEVDHHCRPPRVTDAILAKNRLSLTSPEFTVQEEEGLSSPETTKARPPCQDLNDDKTKQENNSETTGKVEGGIQAEAEADSEAELEDFFPLVGRDVQMRQPATHLGPSLDLPRGELCTSGIVGLKEFLKTQEEPELDDVKSGISRLGHSAAVEKLKQASSEQ